MLSHEASKKFYTDVRVIFLPYAKFCTVKKITYSPALPSVAPAAPVDIVDVDVVVEKVVEEVVVWARFPFFLPASVRPIRPSKAWKVQ